MRHPRESSSLLLKYFCFILLSRTVQVAPFLFPSGAGIVLQRKEPLQQNHQRLCPRHSSQRGGFNQKGCPVTCSPRNKPPAESPKTKAIRGGQLASRLHCDTFLKASIMDKLLVVAVESD